MAKKTTPPTPPVITLAEIEGLTATQAADGAAGQYTIRTRAFVSLGKYVYHLEHRAKLPKGQSIYGMLQSRGVPEGSVHNARMAATFIKTFVEPGLLPESRADEIITHRICHRISQIVTGKTTCALSAAELAAIMKDADKAAIGDELDCLAEHGLTIAAKAEKDEAAAAESKRLADLAAKAEAQEKEAATPPPAADKGARETPTATTTTETPATESTPQAQAPDSPAAETGDGPAGDTPPTIVDGTRDFRRQSGPDPREVLTAIEAAELKSYDLDPAGLTAVREKLAAWMATIDSTLAAPKPEAVALAS